MDENPAGSEVGNNNGSEVLRGAQNGKNPPLIQPTFARY
jgi:hypothetical protein